MTARIADGSNSFPLLGAAVTLDELSDVAGLKNFIFDRDRDIEIRDLAVLGTLSDDLLGTITERAPQLLNGHHGRVGIHGPYEGLEIDTPDTDIRKIVQLRFDAALDVLIAIIGERGGGHMVLHSPYTTWHWHNRGTKLDDSAGILERAHKTLMPIVQKAEDHGITLVLENCQDKDPAERVALAASFDSEAVKVSLDTGHAHYAHGTTAAPPVDVFVRAAGAALAHMHLQDADGFGDRHWAIGRGTIRWHSVFEALQELPEMPRLILELADARELLDSARWLTDAGLAA